VGQLQTMVATAMVHDCLECWMRLNAALWTEKTSYDVQLLRPALAHFPVHAVGGRQWFAESKAASKVPMATPHGARQPQSPGPAQ